MDASIRHVDKAPVPFFRTNAQFRLLGELFTHPDLEPTIGELGRRLRLPQSTVSREIARLADAGLVRLRHEGNRTVVTANHESSIAADLRSLLGKLYGPLAAIRQELADIEGIERAVIFGSWAARWQGRPGPPPRDVDLLVIGHVSYDDVWSVAAGLTRQLGIDVNPTIRTPEEWDDDSTGFAQHVKDSPQVDVTPGLPTQEWP